MSFSVLLSVYGKEKASRLKESLESLFSQTLCADEIVIVEDGPLTSDLYNVLNQFSGNYGPVLKRIPLAKNVGLGTALNIGLGHCKHDLIARMDSDDICFPDRFEKQVKFMEEHPDVDIISSWIEEFEEDINVVKSVKKLPYSHEEISSYIRRRCPLNHPVVMFRKSAVLKVGGYQHFHLFEDYYLWARMFAAGAKFANIQESLLHFRVSPQMIKRRGGLKYARESARLQWMLYKLGIVSAGRAVKSSFIRGTVSLMPNRMRAYFYSKFLRN